jgi:hypothetical protein
MKLMAFNNSRIVNQIWIENNFNAPIEDVIAVFSRSLDLDRASFKVAEINCFQSMVRVFNLHSAFIA